MDRVLTTAPDRGSGTAVPLAQALVAQLLERHSEGFPEAVLRDAMHRVVDTIGVALAGASTPAALAARRAALALGHSGDAAVWGYPERTAPETAVLANATAAHALDYDDSLFEAIMHTGSMVVPIALALAGDAGSSGREVLSAIACGYQVADYLGQLAFKRFQPRGFQSTAVLGVFAGVTTAAFLRRLTADEFLQAFGLCGSFSSGLMEFVNAGGDTKPLQVGWAAHAALVAVTLAEVGAIGSSSVLEGKYGIFQSLAGVELDPGLVAEKPLWEDYAVSRVATKFYPVCHAIHAPADAWKTILRQLREDGLEPEDAVERVTCRVGRFGTLFVLEPRERKSHPASAHEARFSLPYCLARITLDGDLDLDSFRAEALEDPRAGVLADRVYYRVLTPEEEESVVAAVEAHTVDGRHYHAAVSQDARQPELGGWERISEKLFRAAKGVAPRAQLEALLAGAQELLATDSLEPLSAALEAIRLPEPG